MGEMGKIGEMGKMGEMGGINGMWSKGCQNRVEKNDHIKVAKDANDYAVIYRDLPFGSHRLSQLAVTCDSWRRRAFVTLLTHLT